MRKQSTVAEQLNAEHPDIEGARLENIYLTLFLGVTEKSSKKSVLIDIKRCKNKGSSFLLIKANVKSIFQTDNLGKKSCHDLY